MPKSTRTNTLSQQMKKQLKERKAELEHDRVPVAKPPGETADVATRLTRLHWRRRKERKEAANQITDFKLSSRIRKCGERVDFRKTPSGYVVHSIYLCDQWLVCEACALKRQKEMVEDELHIFGQVLASEPDVRAYSVTLTVGTHASLEDGLLRLRRTLAKFKKNGLRRHSGERNSKGPSFNGGCAVFEIARGVKGGWNPHIHAVLLSHDLLTKTMIKNAWIDCGGRPQISVRELTGSHPKDRDYQRLIENFRRVRRYAHKPNEMSVSDRVDALEYLKAIPERPRLYSTFGSMYGKSQRSGPPAKRSEPSGSEMVKLFRIGEQGWKWLQPGHR